MDGEPICGPMASLFLLGSGGRLGRGYRVPRLPVLLQCLISKQQGRQGLPHMPCDVIGQDTQKDRGTDTLFLVVVTRPYQDVDTLQGPQEPLYHRQVFIPAYRILSGQTLGRLARAHHIDAIECCLSLDRGGAPGIAAQAVINLHRKVLGHMVVVQYPTNFLPNRGLGQWFFGPARTLTRRGGEVGVGGLQSGGALAVPFLSDQGIGTGHQPLTGKRGTGDLREGLGSQL